MAVAMGEPARRRARKLLWGGLVDGQGCTNESRRNTYYLIENEKTGLVFGALAERFLVTFLWCGRAQSSIPLRLIDWFLVAVPVLVRPAIAALLFSGTRARKLLVASALGWGAIPANTARLREGDQSERWNRTRDRQCANLRRAAEFCIPR